MAAFQLKASILLSLLGVSMAQYGYGGYGYGFGFWGRSLGKPKPGAGGSSEAPAVAASSSSAAPTVAAASSEGPTTPASAEGSSDGSSSTISAVAVSEATVASASSSESPGSSSSSSSSNGKQPKGRQIDPWGLRAQWGQIGPWPSYGNGFGKVSPFLPPEPLYGEPAPWVGPALPSPWGRAAKGVPVHYPKFVPWPDKAPNEKNP